MLEVPQVLMAGFEQRPPAPQLCRFRGAKERMEEGIVGKCPRCRCLLVSGGRIIEKLEMLEALKVAE
jgi:hypothetical protein